MGGQDEEKDGTDAVPRWYGGDEKYAASQKLAGCLVKIYLRLGINAVERPADSLSFYFKNIF